jgi:hypothetical protein
MAFFEAPKSSVLGEEGVAVAMLKSQIIFRIWVR